MIRSPVSPARRTKSQTVFPLLLDSLALPAETKVESGTSQSKSDLSNSASNPTPGFRGQVPRSLSPLSEMGSGGRSRLPRHSARPVRFIDNLLVRAHCIIVMIRWTGLAPWEFEFTSTFLERPVTTQHSTWLPSHFRPKFQRISVT